MQELSDPVFRNSMIDVISSMIIKSKDDRSVRQHAEQVLNDFITRTNHHIWLVNQCAGILKDCLIEHGQDAEEFLVNVEYHDYDKLHNAEVIPVYALGSDVFYLAKDKLPYEVDKEHLLKLFKERAFPKHRTTNSHHAAEHFGKLEGETWVVPELNNWLVLGEMVADWMAMGITHGDTARDWWNKTNQKRWKFSSVDTDIIEQLLTVEDNANNQLAYLRQFKVVEPSWVPPTEIHSDIDTNPLENKASKEAIDSFFEVYKNTEISDEGLFSDIWKGMSDLIINSKVGQSIYALLGKKKDQLSIGPISKDKLNQNLINEFLKKEAECVTLLKWLTVPDYTLLPKLEKFGEFIDNLYSFKFPFWVFRGIRTGFTFKHAQQNMGLLDDDRFGNILKSHVKKGYQFDYTPIGPMSVARSPWIARVYGNVISSCKVPQSYKKLVITGELAYVLDHLQRTKYKQFREMNLSCISEIVLFPNQQPLHWEVRTISGDIADCVQLIINDTITPSAEGSISTESLTTKRDDLYIGPIDPMTLDFDKVYELAKHPDLLIALKDWTTTPNHDLMPQLQKLGKIVDELYKFSKPIPCYRGIRTGFSTKPAQNLMGTIDDKLRMFRMLNPEYKAGYQFEFETPEPMSVTRAVFLAKVYGNFIVKCELTKDVNKLVITPELSYLLQQMDIDYPQYRQVNLSVTHECIVFPGQKLIYTVVSTYGDITSELGTMDQSAFESLGYIPIESSEESAKPEKALILKKCTGTDEEVKLLLEGINMGKRASGATKKEHLWTEEMVRNAIKRNNQHYFLVQDGSTTVGISSIDEVTASDSAYISKKLKSDCIEVGFVAVFKEHQGKGYGTGLVKATLQYIKDHFSNKPVVIRVNGSNQPALGLYKKMGFQISDNISEDKNKPFYVMELKEESSNEGWFDSGKSYYESLRDSEFKSSGSLSTEQRNKEMEDLNKRSTTVDYNTLLSILTTSVPAGGALGLLHFDQEPEEFSDSVDTHILSMIKEAPDSPGGLLDKGFTRTSVNAIKGKFDTFDKRAIRPCRRMIESASKANSKGKENIKRNIRVAEGYLSKISNFISQNAHVVSDAIGIFHQAERYNPNKSSDNDKKESKASSEAITAKTPDVKRGKISKAHQDMCGKYLYHGTHRNLDIKFLGIHVCKNRANTDIKAPCVYMNRSLGVACLHCVPFMIGHGSKLANYKEHFVNLEEAINSDGKVVNVEIVHNDPKLQECSGSNDGYIYCVKKEDCVNDLYYATPEEPNNWNFVAYKQLPIDKKIHVKVNWHKKYDEDFAKKVKSGYAAVESLQLAYEPINNEESSTEALDPKIKEKRKYITDYICAICDLMDPSKLNSKRYHRLLDHMSDKDFDQWMHYVKDGKWKLHIVAPNLIINLKNENLLKAADKAKCKLFHRLWMTDNATGRQYLTDNEYLVLTLSVRRQQQYLDEKLSVPDNDRQIDGMTGQVTGDSRACSMTNPEIQILAARGLDATLEELVNVRGGNINAYAEFKRQAEETGEISLNTIDRGSISRVAMVGQILLQSMMIDNNIVGN